MPSTKRRAEKGSSGISAWDFIPHIWFPKTSRSLQNPTARTPRACIGNRTGESTYTIEECDRTERGTKIVMHIADAEKEFLDEGRIRSLVEKYCAFMPYNIYLNFTGKDDKPLNDTQPLYLKNPKDCTEEEYKNFTARHSTIITIRFSGST